MILGCKMLENILRKQMDNYLLRRKYASEKQHGFIGNRFCNKNLLDFCNKVITSLKEEKKRKR